MAGEIKANRGSKSGGNRWTAPHTDGLETGAPDAGGNVRDDAA